VGTRGTETVTVEKLRQLIGYNVLRSGFFEVEKTSQGILFKGEGWGHGVGLCQYGAKDLAQKGATYKQILQHYFPGSKIVSYQPTDTFAALQKARREQHD
jgi:stage II sporulation protein D